ncbi:MAG: single-stranded DNA-binding protein [Bacilli bacterium]|nr:single-stranded DNA-binding protein [Bacilli bacterium]MBR2711533.1 single-stranded DNA-binding protein [Bacilli bacterium]
MNKIVLVGRLTKDPEIYENQSQVKVAKFSLAINRNFKNKEGNCDTDFFNCVSFRNVNGIKDYCKKGDLIGVEGRVQNRTYEDEKQNKHYITEIMCDNVEFLSSKSNSTTETQTTKIEPKNESYDNTQIYADFGDSIEISDDIAF